MKIVEVIPISGGIGKDTLSYFTSADVSSGSIVKIPIRGKIKNGIVVSVRSASEAKSDIRSAPFELKKIDELKSQNLFFPEFMASARETADFFASSDGSVLNFLIPSAVLKNAGKLGISSEYPRCIGIHEKLAIQSDDNDRFARYRSIIREEFAKKSSVFLCVPTIEDTDFIFEILSKGIEQYVFVLHTKLGDKKLRQIWEAIGKEEHPVLIISTAKFLCLPRHDIGAIIIEKESARAYKKDSRPFVDLRKFSEILAKKMKIKIIFGDSVLRTETIWKHQNGEIFELAPLQFRFLTSTVQDLVDMKKPMENIREQKFKVLSGELVNLVKETKNNNENMFIFSGRRGLSPQTVCGDCGDIVMCNRCSIPVVLHKKGDSAEDKKFNFFMCHKCGEKRSADERCKKCDSWKLKMLGVGIVLVEEELKKACPDVKIFRMDIDSAPTQNSIKEMFAKFYSSPGSVLIGTEMALSRLRRKVENSAVAGIDSMFSLPDFRMNEKIVGLILKIRSLTSKKFIIQSRNISQRSIKYGIAGNLADFYKEEISEREKFGYSPFKMLIKISLAGEKESVKEEMKKAIEIFSEYNPLIFPAFIEIKKGKYNLNAVIKIPYEKWVDRDLLQKLKSLPQSFSVEIDPENLL